MTEIENEKLKIEKTDQAMINREAQRSFQFSIFNFQFV
jgi:hypothetical protein